MDNRTGFSFDKIFALWVMCWTFIPFMQVGEVYRIVTIVCSLLWVLTALLRDPSFFSRYSSFTILQIVTVLARVLALYVLTGSIVASLTNTLQYIIVVLIALMAFYYFDNDADYIKGIFPVILILIVIFSITTMQATFENPYAARIANSQWLAERFEENKNVGLYGFVYMCVLIEPLLLSTILNKLNFGRLTNILCRIAFVVSFLMILTSGYMIAIFITVGSCAFILAFNKKSNARSLLIVAVILIFFISYKQIIDSIFSLLMSMTEGNPVYYNKFADFRTLFLNGDTTGETVFGRFKNYTQSFETMIHYPIIGSYMFGNAGGGGHSALLDVFGKYGLVAGIMFVYTYMKIPHRVGTGKIKWNILDKTVFFMTFIFSIVDPVFQEIGISLFVIFPLIKIKYNVEIGERFI